MNKIKTKVNLENFKTLIKKMSKIDKYLSIRLDFEKDLIFSEMYSEDKQDVKIFKDKLSNYFAFDSKNVENGLVLRFGRYGSEYIMKVIALFNSNSEVIAELQYELFDDPNHSKKYIDTSSYNWIASMQFSDGITKKKFLSSDPDEGYRELGEYIINERLQVYKTPIYQFEYTIEDSQNLEKLFDLAKESEFSKIKAGSNGIYICEDDDYEYQLLDSSVEEQTYLIKKLRFKSIDKENFKCHITEKSLDGKKKIYSLILFSQDSETINYIVITPNE